MENAGIIGPRWTSGQVDIDFGMPCRLSGLLIGVDCRGWGEFNPHKVDKWTSGHQFLVYH